VVWWTLVTEIQFYLLLPLGMLLWTAGPRGRLCCIVLLLAWAAAYTALVVTGEMAGGKTFLLSKSLFARAPAFLIGIAAAAAWLRLADAPVLRQRSRLVAGLSLALLLLALALLERILLAVTQMAKGAAEVTWHLHHSYEAALWAVVILCLLLGQPPAKRLLVNNALAVVGKLSYSLYLLHVPVLFYLIYPLRESMGPETYQASAWLYLVPAAALVLSLALSLASYHWVEKPFLRRKRALPV
jgi:peptidoglycan/LPS O-acetylase OafA/YrhL